MSETIMLKCCLEPTSHNFYDGFGGYIGAAPGEIVEYPKAVAEHLLKSGQFEVFDTGSIKSYPAPDTSEQAPKPAKGKGKAKAEAEADPAPDAGDQAQAVSTSADIAG